MKYGLYFDLDNLFPGLLLGEGGWFESTETFNTDARKIQ